MLQQAVRQARTRRLMKSWPADCTRSLMGKPWHWLCGGELASSPPSTPRRCSHEGPLVSWHHIDVLS